MQVYKNAEDYKYCSDTHYVESFNNFLLQYHDKRIVFGQDTYNLRTNLSILDWNENVDRKCTSSRVCYDLTNPRRQTELVNRSKKTTEFKENIWINYLEKLYRF